MSWVRYTNADGQMVAMSRVGARRYVDADALGSTVALWDVLGNKTHVYSYWSYGGTRSESNPVQYGSSFWNKYKFVGSLGCRSQADGGVYTRARTYEPKDGRWLAIDPLWPHEEAYAYGKASPQTYHDPTGLQGAIAIGGGVGSVICPGLGTVIGIGIGVLITVGTAVVVGELCKPYENVDTPRPSCPTPPKNRCPEPLRQPLHDLYKLICNKPSTCKGLRAPDDCREIGRRLRNSAACCAGRSIWLWCYPTASTPALENERAKACANATDCLSRFSGCKVTDLLR